MGWIEKDHERILDKTPKGQRRRHEASGDLRVEICSIDDNYNYKKDESS